MIDVDAYLRRINLPSRPAVDLDGLTVLMRAHLEAVPFENLDVFDGVPVSTEVADAFDKVVRRGRGGWCFELNGAFAALLGELGFDVTLLGAAVLVNGPTVVIDHLMLEVTLDRPYLVDVGFGEAFVAPIDLNRRGPQEDPAGTFELIASSQGTTLTRHDGEGVPVPLYRFKRTSRQLPDFDSTSQSMQDDTTNHWHRHPIATRLLSAGADRVSLTGTTLKTTIDGVANSLDLPPDAIDDALREHFGIDRKTH